MTASNGSVLVHVRCGPGEGFWDAMMRNEKQTKEKGWISDWKGRERIVIEGGRLLVDVDFDGCQPIEWKFFPEPALVPFSVLSFAPWAPFLASPQMAAFQCSKWGDTLSDQVIDSNTFKLIWLWMLDANYSRQHVKCSPSGFEPNQDSFGLSSFFSLLSIKPIS
jgi:hypothetical protein